jgi:glycosyltransferase involved in cell wall biosynthesis
MLKIRREQTGPPELPTPMTLRQRGTNAGVPSRLSPLTSRTCPRPAPRVLMVGTHPTKTLGGISTVVRGLLASPVAAAFDFRYVASQADEYGPLNKFLLAAAAFARFAWLLAWWRPQLVYVHAGSNASLYRKALFLALARWAGRRVVAHFHAGDFEHYYGRQGRGGRWLIRRGLGRAHRLIAVSRASCELLRRLLPQAEVTFIPNGLDLSAFGVGRPSGSCPSRGDGGHEPETCAAADDCVRLLFVGAMGRLKGERDLIEAVSRAAEHAPQLRLMMLGHGAESVRGLCEERGVWPRVEQLGPVPMGERFEFYRRADIFVLPSYGEGMPMSVLEALAAGLPVIATRVGGIPELVEEGEQGFLIAPGDVEALAGRIVRLAGDAALRRRMGARSRAQAREFELEAVTARLVAELRRALPGEVGGGSKP